MKTVLVGVYQGIKFRYSKVDVVCAERTLDELILPFSRKRLMRGGVTIHEILTQLKGERGEMFLERYRQLLFWSRFRPIGIF